MKDFKFSKSIKLPKWKTVRCKLVGHRWHSPVVTPFGVTETCKVCKAERFTTSR